MNNDSYPTLMEVAQKVWAKSSGRQDYETTLGDLVGGFTDIQHVNSPTGQLVLTPHGFKQLAKDRFGLPPAIFENGGISNSTKLAILNDLVTTGYGDNPVKVRVAGNQIEAVVSNDYAIFDNADLAAGLIQLQQDKLLPTDTRAMTHYLSPDGRSFHVRLVSEAWNFKLGENGSSKSYLGNLLVSNNELGLGSFEARPAITRHSCMNSLVAQSFFRVAHKFADRGDFIRELGKSAAHISAYAKEMGEQLSHSMNINVVSPQLLFDRIATDLGLPGYVSEATRQYWQSEGSGGSLFDVVQALAYGTQKMTVQEGRRRVNWDNRTQLETKIWGLAEELNRIHTEGAAMEDWYVSDVERVRLRILDVIKGYENQSPVIEQVAYQVERLELN